MDLRALVPAMGTGLRTLVPVILRRLGLARATDLEAERERGALMEATLASYSSCIDRLHAQNDRLHAQNMNLVRDGVAARLAKPPFSTAADRMEDVFQRARADRAKFRAGLDEIYERGRAAVAKAEAERAARAAEKAPTENGREGIDPASFPAPTHANGVPTTLRIAGYDSTGDGGPFADSPLPNVWPPGEFANVRMPGEFDFPSTRFRRLDAPTANKVTGFSPLPVPDDVVFPEVDPAPDAVVTTVPTPPKKPRARKRPSQVGPMVSDDDAA